MSFVHDNSFAKHSKLVHSLCECATPRHQTLSQAPWLKLEEPDSAFQDLSGPPPGSTQGHNCNSNMYIMSKTFDMALNILLGHGAVASLSFMGASKTFCTVCMVLLVTCCIGKLFGWFGIHITGVGGKENSLRITSLDFRIYMSSSNDFASIAVHNFRGSLKEQFVIRNESFAFP